MSAAGVLQAAVVAALRADTALAGLTGVFDATPVRSALPHAVVDDPMLIDWSAKDWTGREGRMAVAIYDAGERPVRLRALIEAGEGAVEAIDPALGEGWRIASLVLVRSRVSRTSAGQWTALSEFRVRIYREHA